MNTKSKDLISSSNTQKMSKFPRVRSPQAVNQKVLSGLFSKEFLMNVKNQLHQNKSPRHKQQTTSSGFSSISSQKLQIQNLRTKMRQLSKQNQDLRQKILQSSQNGKISIENDMLECENTESSIYRNKFKITREVSVQITGRQFRDEIQKLKEKIQNLEMYKTIKQTRFQQLLQKIARYEDQIMILKIKSEDLQQQVRSLKQTIRIQVIDMNGQAWRNTSISDHTYGRGIFGQNGIHLIQQKQEENQMFKNFLNPNKKQQNSLLISNCRDVDVPDQMHISKRAHQVPYNYNQSFNQIDYLISQELDYLHLSQEFKSIERHHGTKGHNRQQKAPDLLGILQQSHIFIDFNAQIGKNAKNKELDQSIIVIQLETKQIHNAPSGMKSGQNVEVNMLNESLVAINLNDF